jgi:hypothetical protein
MGLAGEARLVAAKLATSLAIRGMSLDLAPTAPVEQALQWRRKKDGD